MRACTFLLFCVCYRYIGPKELFDALLQLPIRLSSHRLLNFVTDLIHKDGNVCLSELWAEVMCPQLNHKGFDAKTSITKALVCLVCK
jgi:hypothetical protein